MDSEQVVLMNIASGTISALVTGLLTAKKVNATSRKSEEVAVAAKTAQLFDEMRNHHQDQKTEISDLKSELKATKLEAENERKACRAENEECKKQNLALLTRVAALESHTGLKESLKAQ